MVTSKIYPYSLLILAGLLFSLSLQPALAGNTPGGGTLEKVKGAAILNCGVDIEEPEYTLDDAHGNHALFDADLCKAVAVAVLGRNAAFKIKPYRDEAESLKALKEGEIDMLATGSPYMRWSNGGLVFGRPVFYDRQGILVNKALGVKSLKEFAGKKVCFLVGTEIEWQVKNFMSREQIKYIPGPFSEEGEMEAALVTGTCAAVTADVSQLAYERIAFKNMAASYEILPETIAQDPLAPVTRGDDPQWSAVVDWAMQALILAEEAGVTQANVLEMAKSEDIDKQRLLGTQRGWGQFLGLSDDWAAREIEAMGNYGEIFERDLGAGSPMKLERGLNRLWNQGGVMFAEPMR